jgi:hypothetical protein
LNVIDKLWQILVGTMGRKSRAKQKRKKKEEASPANAPTAKTEALVDQDALGDLRLIEAHVEQMMLGSNEAEVAIRIMGRDAVAIVAQLGQQAQNQAVLDLAKKLVAVSPEVTTNLFALREASILGLVELALVEAPEIESTPVVSNQITSIGLFDPVCVGDVLIKTGRVRTKSDRLGRGDLAFLPLAPNTEYSAVLHLGPPPEGQSTTELRLRVESGVIFVGPPEASDGERLGSIRFDPFATRLNQFLTRGGFVRVAPGFYQVATYSDGDKVCFHLTSSDLKDPGPLDPASIMPPPAAIS